MSDFFYREEAATNLYIRIFDDKIFIDQDTLSYILIMLNNIYCNYLVLLFLISCAGGMSCLYLCTNNKNKKNNKEYILINNVEPIITPIKGGNAPLDPLFK
jgi:hypothetical protein